MPLSAVMSFLPRLSSSAGLPQPIGRPFSIGIPLPSRRAILSAAQKKRTACGRSRFSTLSRDGYEFFFFARARLGIPRPRRGDASPAPHTDDMDASTCHPAYLYQPGCLCHPACLCQPACLYYPACLYHPAFLTQPSGLSYPACLF